MSPPSSRQPDDPNGGGAERSSRGRRHDRTVFEVEQTSLPAPRRREEKRTIFGMAREVLGIGESAPAPRVAEPTYDAAQRIAVAQVRSVGGASEAPPRPPLAELGVTAPQFRVRHEAAPAEPRGPHAATHELPQNPVHVARPAQTPMPAPASHLSRGQPEYDATPRRDAHEREAHAAPPAAYGTQVPGASRAQQAPTASLGGPDASTAFVDMRQFMARGVELPEIGRTEQPAARWNVQSAVVTEPENPAPMRVAGARWARRAAAQDEQVDVNFVLGRMSNRTLLLFGACVVALALAAISVFTRPVPSAPTVAEPSAVRKAPVRKPVRSAVAPAAAREDEQPLEAEPKQAAAEPVQARSGQVVAARRDSEPAVQAAEAQEPAIATAQDEPGARGGQQRAEHVSASPERAAALYIGGKYKEALSEYRLLATAYPRQRVYKELARILKRKIIDTCLRTQPNRREQCKEI